MKTTELSAPARRIYERFTAGTEFRPVRLLITAALEFSRTETEFRLKAGQSLKKLADETHAAYDALSNRRG